MAYLKQIGIPFSLKKDWRALFSGNAWFMWREMRERDGYKLRRLNIFSFIMWYVVQFAVWVLLKTLHPLCLFVDHFYWNVEGKSYMDISGIMWRTAKQDMKFFRLSK